jgi:hypothetical protein
LLYIRLNGRICTKKKLSVPPSGQLISIRWNGSKNYSKRGLIFDRQCSAAKCWNQINLKSILNSAFLLFWSLRPGRDHADFWKFFKSVIYQERQEVLKLFHCHIKDKVMKIMQDFWNSRLSQFFAYLWPLKHRAISKGLCCFCYCFVPFLRRAERKTTRSLAIPSL